MTIHDTLNDILDYCDNHIDALNCGGCGKIAYLLIKELEQRKINYKIKIRGSGYTYPSWIDFDTMPIRDLVPYLNEHKTARFTCGHMWLEVKGIDYNESTSKVHDIVPSSLKDRFIYHLRRAAERQDPWNRRYDRNQNKKLQQAVKYYFKKFDQYGNNNL